MAFKRRGRSLEELRYSYEVGYAPEKPDTHCRSDSLGDLARVITLAGSKEK